MTARVSPAKAVTVILPLHTVSESNARGHWRSRHQRAKKQRADAKLIVGQHTDPDTLPPKPWRITITRVGKQRLDTGNLPASVKAIQDGICDALGIDDGDPAHEWVYEQRTAKTCSVELEITPTAA